MYLENILKCQTCDNYSFSWISVTFSHWFTSLLNALSWPLPVYFEFNIMLHNLSETNAVFWMGFVSLSFLIFLNKIGNVSHALYFHVGWWPFTSLRHVEWRSRVGRIALSYNSFDDIFFVHFYFVAELQFDGRLNTHTVTQYFALDRVRLNV